MKLITLAPLLLSGLPLALSQIPLGQEMKCSQAVWTDKAWNDAKEVMAGRGECMYYKGSRDPDLSGCGKGCEGGVEAVGCMAKYAQGIEDPKGDCMWGGNCICPKDVEWVGDLIVTIVTALGEFFQNIINAVVCSGILDAIVMTVDIGLSLIPGGAIASTAMRTGIRIAKSISEAGSDKTAFEDWFGAQCDGKKSGVDQVWKDWTGVGDDVLPSFPGGECLKSGKKKKNCKKEPSEEDDKKKEQEAKDKWEKEHNSSTKKTESKTSSSVSSTKSVPKSTSASTSSKASSSSSSSNKPSSTNASSTSKVSSSSSASSSKAASSTGASSSKVSSSTVTSSSKISSVSGTTSAKPSSSGASSSSKVSSSNVSSSSKVSSTVKSSSASKTGSATSSAASSEPSEEPEKPEAPVFVGAIKNCIKWHVVAAGQDCASTGLSTPELVELNTGLDSTCDNLMAGIAYCIEAGVEEATSGLGL
ncbi:unnamed protein product [Periconia digitata]|uniref:LysM domain-containing protein n=1 Tax=Periconia digitata TaxID=1303443 RepID=A0A9W4XQV8_9PLEO|nr:unnamed protein product [Periconia digitata]